MAIDNIDDGPKLNGGWPEGASASRDARAEMTTGPQKIVQQKVVQLPGTTPAPEIDLTRSLARQTDDFHDLVDLSKESREAAVESQAKADAFNAAMLAQIEAQTAATNEQLSLARRATEATEAQAAAMVRIAVAIESFLGVEPSEPTK